jgi:hypothetical protein
VFDGDLPSSKREERLSRVQQMSKRVTQLRSLYSTNACPIPTSLGSTAFPFLAPALMEALHATDFSSVTHNVPGEADDWCASYAKTNPRSIIFTGDTDLILYEYPPEVLVIFFKDVDILPASESKAFSPTGICQQLQLDSLIPLAYALHEDRWKPFSENVTQARTQNLESLQYLEFSKRYTNAVRTPTYLALNTALNASLQSLDVRTSEFVHQALAFSQTPTDHPRQTPLALSAFPPFLVEDPFRTSAWTAGEHIRLLAYSLITPTRFAVQEHRRKAQGVAVQELTPYQQTELHTKIVEVLDTLLPPPSNQDLSPVLYWRLVATKIYLCDAKPPHIALMARVVSGDFDNTWAFIHLSAYLQATLYSLRMLKQCLPIWLALNGTHPASGLHKAATNILATVPSISDLFTVPGQAIESSWDEAVLLDAVRDVYKAAGVEDKQVFEEQKSRKQKKRDKRQKAQARTNAQPSNSTSQGLGNNVFAILDS